MPELHSRDRRDQPRPNWHKATGQVGPTGPTGMPPSETRADQDRTLAVVGHEPNLIKA